MPEAKRVHVKRVVSDELGTHVILSDGSILEYVTNVKLARQRGDVSEVTALLMPEGWHAE